MTSPVTGAVRIMPAVGHGVPGTSTGVIETDSVFTQRCLIHTNRAGPCTVFSAAARCYSTTYYPPFRIADACVMLSDAPLIIPY